MNFNFTDDNIISGANWTEQGWQPDRIWDEDSRGNWTFGVDTGELDDEPLYQPPLSLVIFLSLCYGSISVAAVVGNGLVIWVILTSRRMRNVTNYYIANLALADIAIGMFAIPFEFQAALLQRWVLPDFMCPFCPFVKVLSISVSVLSLTFIALDRYQAIMHPLKSRTRLSKTDFRVKCSLIWIVAALSASPYLYALRVIPHPENSAEWWFCDSVNIDPESWKFYHIGLVIVQYVVPLLAISIAYERMGMTLWGSSAPGNAQSERDANIMRNKKRVIKMLVIVVALFALCWLPLQTYHAIQHFTDVNSFKYINIFWFASDWLAMSNSCYNPFIYAIYNEKFKREFQVRLRAPCVKKHHRAQPLTRELSGFESSRFDWKRSTIEKNGTKSSVVTLH